MSDMKGVNYTHKPATDKLYNIKNRALRILVKLLILMFISMPTVILPLDYCHYPSHSQPHQSPPHVYISPTHHYHQEKSCIA